MLRQYLKWCLKWTNTGRENEQWEDGNSNNTISKEFRVCGWRCVKLKGESRQEIECEGSWYATYEIIITENWYRQLDACKQWQCGHVNDAVEGEKVEKPLSTPCDGGVNDAERLHFPFERAVEVEGEGEEERTKASYEIEFLWEEEQ